MRYHLKEDGTAGVCKAEVGNCPKGDAIHGESIQEVYTQLEAVMQEQLFETGLFDKIPPRPSAREIGSAGMMLTYTKPVIVKEQLEALKKLGLLEEALPTLEAHSPVLAAAWRNSQEDLIDYDRFYVEPTEYTYEGEGSDEGARFIGRTKTWVAHTAYELQTVAINSFMDRLENSTLEGDDLDSYRIALGQTSESDNGFMAFNYNGDRQDHDFFNNVKNRLVKEGLDKKEYASGRSSYTVPSFIWAGLNKEQKERFADRMIAADYNPHWAPAKTFQDRVLNRNVFSEIIASPFDLQSYKNNVVQEDTVKDYALGWESKVSGKFTLTEAGFDWQETSRSYTEPKKPTW